MEQHQLKKLNPAHSRSLNLLKWLYKNKMFFFVIFVVVILVVAVLVVVVMVVVVFVMVVFADIVFLLSSSSSLKPL